MRILLIGLLLVSCSGGNEGSVSSGSGGFPAVPTLESGTWVSNCFTSTPSIGKVALFSGGNFVKETYVFTDSSCASLNYVVQELGTYIRNGTNLDLTFSDIKLYPMTPILVNSYNTNTYCGYNDWAVAIGKSVAGRNCGGTLVRSAGSMLYDIHYIEPVGGFMGSQLGDMKFGTSGGGNNGATPATRYTWTDGTYIYRIQ